MRNTARELTDGLHFLALDKLRLEGLQFSGVVQHRDQNCFALFHDTGQRHLDKDLLVATRKTQEL